MEPTRSSQSVILCELQCGGVTHVPFNAALLYTTHLAYPGAEIVFYGEHAHLDHVRECLRRFHDAEWIDFRPIRIPRYPAYDQRRLPLEFLICRRMLADASRRGSQALIFSSVTNTSLLSLKFLMHVKQFHLPTAVVVHGCLSTISGPQPRRPWNWITDLRRVLAMPHPRSLRLVALGDSILQNVRKAQPKRQTQWSALDHVYLWSSNEPEVPHPPDPPGQPLRLGFLGGTFKGFDAFCQLADDVAPSPETLQFVIVGYHTDSPRKKPVCRYVPNIPNQPLSRRDFEEQIRKLTYIVWTAPPERYRLVASGTFLDAMAFLKPGIYFRNDYVEHYFKRMGDIGYLCDSHAEMVDTITKIAANFPTERYQRQVENIRKGRALFQPEVMVPRLRQILDRQPT